ncbi:uncharacterized protein LOC126958073 isoform X2 [Macaca thibetana thibetana]|uniref:uncharacterized protein LOC126958073 isoform X2 n=1 Tax=Macaca thibetana thibetana TaxID=257877 RepID=UPI0021BC321E|nr:uncharacterized protein LOC126958073 isoform X2 [Macaca thibetana thibetana]
MDKGRLYPRSRILSTLTAGNHSSVLCVYYFRACGQRRGGARQSGISSDTVFRLRLPAQGLAIRSGQRPPEQPEADGGDPGQQRGRTEHRAVGRPVRAAERLVRAAAHRRGAGPGTLCSPALRRILKPKKKHRRKKKLMNRKRMPQRFTEAGLHWIKTLLIRGSVSLLANSVCLWFSSCNSFLGQSPYRELNEAQKKAQGTGRTSAGKRLLDPVLPLTCWGSSRKLLPLCGLSFLRWSFALVAQAGVQCCNLTLPQPPPPRFK